MPEQRRFTPSTPSGLRRFGRALLKRPSPRHLTVGILVGLLGFAAVVQVRGDESDILEGARRDELLQILDGLQREGDRLEDEIVELEQDRRDLASGTDSELAAREQAEQRLERLKVLTGEVPATGPGVRIFINDPQGTVSASVLRSSIAELRSAGAEAIEIEGGNGAEARVVVDTYFADDTGGGISVSGITLQPPYTISAIGDAATLSKTASFPDSISDDVAGNGGTTNVIESEELTIDALHEPRDPEYAQPAPDEDDD